MNRMKPTAQTTPNLLSPPVLNPLAVYTPAQARALLGLAASTLKAERRAGRLRIGKRGNRYFILGSWLWEWLQGGELPSRRPAKSV